MSNGRLPASSLAKIPGGRLRKDAAAAWVAMCDEARARQLTVPRPTSTRTAYRTYAEQEEFWRLYKAGGALAARPGTSNHGLGIAVDVATPEMRHTIDRIGAQYGWAKKWSDAPGEWWHIRFDPNRVTFARTDILGPKAERWAEEYLKLKRLNQDRPRRAVLRRILVVRRKAEWAAARAGSPARRKAAQRRYEVLASVTA